MVDRETNSGDAIFALPVHPELYYLANRRNPTQLYNTALALHSEADTPAAQGVGRSPPKLVFYNPKSSYITAESSRIMDWVHAHYDPIETLGTVRDLPVQARPDGDNLPDRPRYVETPGLTSCAGR